MFPKQTEVFFWHHRVPIRLTGRGGTLRIARVRVGRRGTVPGTWISVMAEVSFNSYFIAKMLPIVQLSQQAPVPGPKPAHHGRVRRWNMAAPHRAPMALLDGLCHWAGSKNISLEA